MPDTAPRLAKGEPVLEQLELLLDLQHIDLELGELVAEADFLPERIQVLEDEKERAKTGVRDSEARLEETRKARQKLERDLEDHGARLKDLESKRLMIKTNEEYAALTHEIGFTTQDISKTEDEALEFMESEANIKRKLAAAQESAATRAGEIDVKIGEFTSELERLNDAIAIKRDERLRVSTRIAGPTLLRYDRILASKGDFAVARIADGACEGCYVRLPAQMVIEVRTADRFIECESCGRILCWRPERDEG